MPHVRGDEPGIAYAEFFDVNICPTHVGMNRSDHNDSDLPVHLPHAGGDEPNYDAVKIRLDLFAPRTWG